MPLGLAVSLGLPLLLLGSGMSGLVLGVEWFLEATLVEPSSERLVVLRRIRCGRIYPVRRCRVRIACRLRAGPERLFHKLLREVFSRRRFSSITLPLSVV